MNLENLYPIIIPAVTSIFLLLIKVITRNSERNYNKLYGGITTISFLVAFYFALNIIFKLLSMTTHIVEYYSLGPPIGSCFEVDLFSAVVGTIAIGLAFIVSLYSMEYMQHDKDHLYYYVLLLALVTAIVGVVYAGDFFTLFLFYELMGVSSYFLVAFRKYNWDAAEASMKYLFMGAAGSTSILLAMSFLYGLTGSLNFAQMAQAMQANTHIAPYFYLIIVLLISGFGVKTSIVPMHSWLIDAHPSAPSGISAMLSGIVIKTGLYAMIRILFLVFPIALFDWNWLLLIVAIITMTLPNIIALVQDDIKRLLAYSSIYNIGLILVAIGAGTQFAIASGLFHVLNHAIMKGLAFMCAGALIHATGTRSIKELRGIGRKMPLTGTTFAISLLALAGVPPFNGFVSKLFVILATLQYTEPVGFFVAIITLLNSAIAAAYYARLLKAVWMEPDGSKISDAKETYSFMSISFVVLTILIVFIGVYPYYFFDIIYHAAESFLDYNLYIISAFGG